MEISFFGCQATENIGANKHLIYWPSEPVGKKFYVQPCCMKYHPFTVRDSLM